MFRIYIINHCKIYIITYFMSLEIRPWWHCGRRSDCKRGSFSSILTKVSCSQMTNYVNFYVKFCILCKKRKMVQFMTRFSVPKFYKQYGWKTWKKLKKKSCDKNLLYAKVCICLNLNLSRTYLLFHFYSKFSVAWFVSKILINGWRFGWQWYILL